MFKKNELNKNLIISFLIILLGLLHLAHFSDYPHTTQLSKFLLLYLISVVLFLLYLINILIIKNIKVHITKLDIGLAILFFYTILNTSIFYRGAVFSIRYYELLCLSVIYCCFRIFKSIQINIFWILLIIISGIIQAIYGSLQLLGFLSSNHSNFKITGSFFNPGPYASFLSIIFVLSLGVYLFKNRVFRLFLGVKKVATNQLIKFIFKYIPFIGITTIIIVIPATHSRASWLAIVFSSLILLELRFRCLKRFLFKISIFKKYLLLVVSFVLFIIGLLAIYFLKKDSSDGRLLIWKISHSIFKDYPVLGVGFDKFKSNYMNYQASYFEQGGTFQEKFIADNTIYAFNEFIQFFIENGVVGGFILMYILYIVLFEKLNKENILLGIIVKLVLLSIGVISFFSYPSQILPIKIILVFLLSFLSNEIKIKYSFSLNKKWVTYRVKSGLFFLGIIIVYNSFKRLCILDWSFQCNYRGMVYSREGDYELSIKEFEKSFPVLKKDGEFMTNYGRTLFFDKKYDEALSVLKKAKEHQNSSVLEIYLGDCYKSMGKYKESELSYKRALYMVPSRFYPMYLLLVLYRETNNTTKAVLIAKEILNKEIKVPSIAVKEIQEKANEMIKINRN
ncbi:O-antigen ligase [Wenyingzhuangia heitensis]|uniref:O-antigen ligase n=1 Tax=Wenyingzhuangia heitensis TaxID=1487859 RepID=A0ABX0UHZ4_9FLAO|nr:O-antigen ligase family protein [Wenyingzhuangia heitensis]NIJ46637.1 O-antigen ligase [Wenyingzhuangia heitensis]